MSGKTALIVGATGLVGKELLNVLLENGHYSKILIVGRNSTGVKDNSIEELLINFDNLADYKDQISAHDYYCCIGTAMEVAKSKEAFYKVDFTYTLELAKMSLADTHCCQFHVVSSYGANANSGLFYNAIKGKIEDALIGLNLRALHIFQPSLLLGVRNNFRLWEEAAKIVSSVLSFFIIGSRLKFWAIEGREVAKSMFYVALSGEVGVHVHKPLEMKRIARTKEYKGGNSVTTDV